MITANRELTANSRSFTEPAVTAKTAAALIRAAVRGTVLAVRFSSPREEGGHARVPQSAKPEPYRPDRVLRPYGRPDIRRSISRPAPAASKSLFRNVRRGECALSRLTITPHAGQPPGTLPRPRPAYHREARDHAQF